MSLYPARPIAGLPDFEPVGHWRDGAFSGAVATTSANLTAPDPESDAMMSRKISIQRALSTNEQGHNEVGHRDTQGPNAATTACLKMAITAPLLTGRNRVL
ncbi:MAG: hypothetical protein KGQ37_12235 [Hyphomicrobiales bacterium]|nr:hypothetical protein [Hyphomicrobiales bacterium]